jgi:hypothetical protein
LIVGGYAIALHGHPRYTKDLDLWIWLDQENAKKVVNVLDKFGFSGLDYKIEDLLNPDLIIQLGVPPNRIDLIMELTGVEFESCYASKQIIKIDDLDLPVINLENLKKNKKALGRHQDLADLENLE